MYITDSCTWESVMWPVVDQLHSQKLVTFTCRNSRFVLSFITTEIVFLTLTRGSDCRTGPSNTGSTFHSKWLFHIETTMGSRKFPFHFWVRREEDMTEKVKKMRFYHFWEVYFPWQRQEVLPWTTPWQSVRDLMYQSPLSWCFPFPDWMSDWICWSSNCTDILLRLNLWCVGSKFRWKSLQHIRVSHMSETNCECEYTVYVYVRASTVENPAMYDGSGGTVRHGFITVFDQYHHISGQCQTFSWHVSRLWLWSQEDAIVTLQQKR